MTRTHFSLRMDEEILNRLEERARISGATKSALAKRYVEEGLRMDSHPGIVFRDGPAGRRAGLAGSGLDVWEIIETVHHNEGSVRDAAEYLNLAASKVQSVADYYAEFKQEIDDWIESNAALAAQEEAAWGRGREVFKAAG